MKETQLPNGYSKAQGEKKFTNGEVEHLNETNYVNYDADGDGDSDALEEDFLLKAISAVQDNISGDEDGDGIDDIDIDFDEGDSSALIHESKSVNSEIHTLKVEENNNTNVENVFDVRIDAHTTDLGSHTIKEEGSEDSKEITVEISNPRSFNNEHNQRSTKHTIHYKPQAISIRKDKPKETLSDLKARHDFMCSCDSCQVLYDTYKDFVNIGSKAEKTMSEPLPKLPKEFAEAPATAHLCNTCNTLLSSYKDYRIHLQQMHPRHWQTIQEFEEKRKSVVRKTTAKHVPLHGNFFKKELQRVTNSHVVTPVVNIQKQETPIAYFYPMVYPVYLMMDNNNKHVLNIGQPQSNFQPNKTVIQPLTTPTVCVSPQQSNNQQVESAVDQPNNKHEPFVCGNCGLTFTYKDHLVLHMRIHNEKPFKCDSCGVSFINNVELKRHYRTHTFTKKCDLCSESFVSYGQLREHVSSVHKNKTVAEAPQGENEPPRRCPICDLDFDTRELWENHMVSHSHRDDVFLCQQCGLSFNSKNALQQHVSNHPKPPFDIKKYTSTHRNLKILYKCKQCTFTSGTAAAFYKHKKREHSSDKAYECEECGALFKTNSQRKAHILTHTGERPFKCHLCDATFIQQGNLKRHIWSHTGEKPHGCEQCGARFLSTSDLKRHTRTHTGEKPYKCHLCTFTFTTSGNLKSHLKTHLEYISAKSIPDDPNGNDCGVVNIKEEPMDNDDLVDAIPSDITVVKIKQEDF